MEDGMIEYEFFFEHGRMNASPVLDRLCLRPNMDGVHTHWLTDGRFDRTQTAPDNDAIETECQSHQGQLPLKKRRMEFGCGTRAGRCRRTAAEW